VSVGLFASARSSRTRSEGERKAGLVRFEHDGYQAGEDALIEREVASLL
jgi:hypothetical protein